MEGKLIIIEGIDGSGTTTQAKLLAQILKKENLKIKLTKEPLDNKIIDLIKKSSDNLLDLFLFLADRRKHYLQIQKWLGENKWVISDRSFPSTLVYQWYATNLKKVINEKLIIFLNGLSQLKIKPNFVFILDVEPEIALQRLIKKNNKSKINKYEKLALLKKFREGYLYFAKKYNWKIIDGQKQIKEINKIIYNQII
ncbi:MAG: dTMP kinase [Patescibacteria group bacterium]|nr:dTMP kinase [Patescibacteria group bacterium]